MQSKIRWLYLLPVTVFVGIGIFLAIGLTRDPSKLPSVLVGKPAPVFELEGITGRDEDGLATANLKGEASLVNVFASWCVPCRIEHPLITQLAREGYSVHGLNYKDDPNDALNWLRALGDPYDLIGMDKDGRVGFEWGVYGVPETFVINKEGDIIHKHVGPLSDRDMDEIRGYLDAANS